MEEPGSATQGSPNTSAAPASVNNRDGSPWWIHVVAGLVLGAAVVCIFLAPGILKGLTVVVAAVAMWLIELLRRYSAGARRGNKQRTRASVLVVVVFAAVIVAVVAVGWGFASQHATSWVAWPTGLAVTTLVATGGVLFDRT